MKNFRKCVVCGEVKEKSGLFRIARQKTGEILFDQQGKEPGRGAYVCRDAACRGKLKKARGLERSFRTRIPDEVYERIEKSIHET